MTRSGGARATRSRAMHSMLTSRCITEPERRRRDRDRARARARARVGARIQSDHVVQVIAAGVEPSGNLPWLVMELLQGEELEKRVRRDGPLAWSIVAEVMRQLCHALSAAHAVGVVHRDLKPNNLFL